MTGILALARVCCGRRFRDAARDTPRLFVCLAPFLVTLASLAMLVQPWLTARTPRESGRLRLLTWPLIGLVSIYSGYFGAGSGIMVLAVLLVLVDNRYPRRWSS